MRLGLAFESIEAVKEADAFPPDVILLDLGLPKMDGYEVARKIQQQSRGKQASNCRIRSSSRKTGLPRRAYEIAGHGN